jgi:hypothetical protein
MAERIRRRRRARSTAVTGAVVVAVLGAAVWFVNADEPSRITSATDPAVSTPTADTVASVDGSSTTAAPTTVAPATVAPPTTAPLFGAAQWSAVPPDPRGVTTGGDTVWTGSEAIMVGGLQIGGAPRDGVVAFDPVASSWRVVSTDPIPVTEPIVAWTGSTVLAIGNTDGGDAPGSVGAFTLDPFDGNGWQPAATSPVTFSTLPDTTSVWTGSELLVLAGMGSALAYDPANDSWRAIAVAPLAAFRGVASVWTGTEWVLWGGQDGVQDDAEGAAYDPVSDAWRSIAPAPLSARRFSGTGAVWTGTEMIVTAGMSGGDRATGNFVMALSDGAAYDPVTDTWRNIGSGPAHPGFSPIWTGTLMVLFAKGTAVMYDPLAARCPAGCAPGEWSDFFQNVVPHDDVSPVWTGSVVVLLGSYDASTGGAVFAPPA